MEYVKSIFNIKDLENLSGIKSHTIRIWEKRYNLLSPERTDSNIRFYNIENLRKLLNVTILYNNGFKISKLSKLNEVEINELIKELILKKNSKEQYLNYLKLSMLTFDHLLFDTTYNKLIAEDSFSNVFVEIFIPLLFEIGLLWQINTICPAHEHFISNLIKQKIYANIERVQFGNELRNDKIYVLYLPDNEIHELGLLFIHYMIIKKGFKSIYIGQSVPIEDLEAFKDYGEKLTFISFFTTHPMQENLQEYLNDLDKLFLNVGCNFLIAGKKLDDPTIEKPSSKFTLIPNVKNILELI
ncbi:MerR family transcriptional regulator [Flexithrix dorotheae]|uniref:MerR family transcriptional regulator n=1 Tax=Flexithrix dorotheae TaxID=70993 RepID=UPI00146CE4CC|nr:MerR family transcriptional regulator [Flexithrix dorotheae]